MLFIGLFNDVYWQFRNTVYGFEQTRTNWYKTDMRIYSKRYSKEIKEKVVHAIVNGHLWLEEAMETYNISDRRVIIEWLRKDQRQRKK